MRVLLLLSAVIFAAAYGYRHIGCFRDHPHRAIAGGIRFRGSPARCEQYARAHHWRVFSVQYGGECFTAPNAYRTYGRYGRAGNCRHGRGGGWANDVYEVSGWRHWHHRRRMARLRAAYRRHYLHFRGLANRQRRRLHAYNVRYNSSRRNMIKFANKQRYWVRRANAQARSANALRRSHAAYVRRIHAARRACNNRLRSMVRAANARARRQRGFHSRYVAYRRNAMRYRRMFFNARRHYHVRARQRAAAYRVYNRYVHYQNTWVHRYNKIRG